MKVFTIVLLSIILSLGCKGVKPSQQDIEATKAQDSIRMIPDETIDTLFGFEQDNIGHIPTGWTQNFTGRGDFTNWKIVNDDNHMVLAQLSADNPNYHFNIIVNNKIRLRNMMLKVKIKGVDGSKDQGGGFVWRYIDKNNYYVVRANPLEDNVVLYKVKNGKRTDLALLGKGRTYGMDVEQLGENWNELQLKVMDNLFTVFLNGKQLFQVRDETFKTKGKVGLWTKADAVTYFDDFEIKSIHNGL